MLQLIGFSQNHYRFMVKMLAMNFRRGIREILKARYIQAICELPGFGALLSGTIDTQPINREEP